jgi:hypothetical protein
MTGWETFVGWYEAHPDLEVGEAMRAWLAEEFPNRGRRCPHGRPLTTFCRYCEQLEAVA